MILLDALPVKRGRNRVARVLPPKYLHRLRAAEIEKEFLNVVLDLKVILVLDGIDEFEDPPSVRIRSHDLHGQLPEIVTKNSGDTFRAKDQLAIEACKLNLKAQG